MDVRNLVSEEKAAYLAGVSTETLNRLADSGYLQTEYDDLGILYYFRDALGRIFKLKDEDQEESSRSEKIVPFRKSENSLEEEKEPIVAQPESDSPQNTKPSLDNIVEIVREIRPIGDGVFEESSYSRDQNILKESGNRFGPGENEDENSLLALEIQIDDLSGTMDSQDLLLADRDLEIKNLENEVDWLQQRIGVLEDKCSRNQLLLLSDTKMLGRLVAERDSKRGQSRIRTMWNRIFG